MNQVRMILPQILNPNPYARLTIDEIIDHTFFEETRKEVIAAQGKVNFMALVPSGKETLVKDLVKTFY